MGIVFGATIGGLVAYAKTKGNLNTVYIFTKRINALCYVKWIKLNPTIKIEES